MHTPIGNIGTWGWQILLLTWRRFSSSIVLFSPTIMCLKKTSKFVNIFFDAGDWNPLYYSQITIIIFYNKSLHYKFRQSGVPIQSSSLRRIINLWCLSWIKARYWYPKFVLTRMSNSPLVWSYSNTTMLTRKPNFKVEVQIFLEARYYPWFAMVFNPK